MVTRTSPRLASLAATPPSAVPGALARPSTPYRRFVPDLAEQNPQPVASCAKTSRLVDGGSDALEAGNEILQPKRPAKLASKPPTLEEADDTHNDVGWCHCNFPAVL
ncbi:hypothetical protein BD289DRAFT_481052 [Coniella lustricola]|uniref:Uncharacterized protein n=1 Tax=Coniella lustricola TaxID=2025994 RepID=A0A2T3ADN8_9PEZI|nr:hypothetical protein BD289DRAFT_481052 [Coniella lustricola]